MSECDVMIGVDLRLKAPGEMTVRASNEAVQSAFNSSKVHAAIRDALAERGIHYESAALHNCWNPVGVLL